MNMNTEITAIEDLRRKAWEDLRKSVESCQKCPLHQTRQHTVFGEGPTENCRCVLIGEAPGETEDEKGQPFVGKAGQLLTKILSDCGISRDEVYITNILKCRPPNNRDPKQSEMKACEEHLEAQLALLHPDMVVPVGRISAQWLLNTDKTISDMRGQWIEWRGIYIFPIFHPSYLLRNKGNTAPTELTYRDVKTLRIALNRLKSR